MQAYPLLAVGDMLNDLFININEAECGYSHRHYFGYREGKPEHIDIIAEKQCEQICRRYKHYELTADRHKHRKHSFSEGLKNGTHCNTKACENVA